MKQTMKLTIADASGAIIWESEKEITLSSGETLELTVTHDWSSARVTRPGLLRRALAALRRRICSLPKQPEATPAHPERT